MVIVIGISTIEDMEAFCRDLKRIAAQALDEAFQKRIGKRK